MNFAKNPVLYGLTENASRNFRHNTMNDTLMYILNDDKKLPLLWIEKLEYFYFRRNKLKFNKGT